ncbi:HET domain-containing protein [Pochonia chlamydosporia 170]|uniref:HET domain-containing protein n=1 Tax=Pochonia chlamydosporia 170 TaxID=1380566 RepID=A0A179FLW4_METCM|nr:HET domain-containing protein [Pochonia chlamydosporia 170]OAQ66220.1 HET domain-containing protein [Pochonia chlamydosporia 170]
MPLLQTLKALTRRPRRCGACLFELDPRAKTLRTDLDVFVGSAFATSDRHTVSHESFITSSSRGCEKCNAILEAIAQQGISFQTAEWNYLPQRSGQGPHLELLEPGILFELCTNASVPEDKFSRRHMCLWNGTKLSGSTGDATSLKLASTWINTCRSQHAQCQPPSEFVPTRLLQISETDNTTIQLVQNPTTCSYAALSHRWTPETQTSRLEKSNLAQRLATGIPIKLFPQVMQDAILVSQTLGIKYIWIDSMCIIQDSKEDWLHEAATMASIYTNAELTVAASWCATPGQSLFSNRTHIAIDITSFNNEGVFLRRLNPHFTWQDVEHDWFKDDPYTDAEAEWPLLSRGWVYQEQLLSRRMLHFTKDEIIWECNECTVCECRPVQTADSTGPRVVKLPVVSKSWSQIIQEYAKRSLTFPTDRLPALAGVAKAFGGKGTREYLCGLWGDDLEGCFFWYVAGGISPRPDMYMPSWSWASTTGNIETWGSSIEDLEFKGHRVVYGGDEHMGDVREGEITLTGRIVHGTAFWKLAGDGLVFGVAFDGKQFKVHADYNWDSEGRWLVADGCRVAMLLFGQSTRTNFDPDEGSNESVIASCLVLRCVDEDKGVYERVGVTHGEGMRDEEYLDFDKVKAESEIMTITII